MVMSDGLLLTAGGILFGLVVAIASTHLLGYVLYNTSPRDPIAFVSALAMMTIVAAVACLLPAWRASRTDPLRALRS
jgi:putative ABC transport system permease protein